MKILKQFTDQARFKAVVKESRIPLQKVILPERTVGKITPELYALLQDFENKTLKTSSSMARLQTMRYKLQ